MSRAFTNKSSLLEVSTPTPNASRPQAAEAQNAIPALPTNPCSTGVGRDAGYGSNLPPAFSGGTRKSQLRGYLTVHTQRF